MRFCQKLLHVIYGGAIERRWNLTAVGKRDGTLVLWRNTGKSLCGYCNVIAASLICGMILSCQFMEVIISKNLISQVLGCKLAVHLMMWFWEHAEISRIGTTGWPWMGIPMKVNAKKIETYIHRRRWRRKRLSVVLAVHDGSGRCSSRLLLYGPSSTDDSSGTASDLLWWQSSTR